MCIGTENEKEYSARYYPSYEIKNSGRCPMGNEEPCHSCMHCVGANDWETSYCMYLKKEKE